MRLALLLALLLAASLLLTACESDPIPTPGSASVLIHTTTKSGAMSTMPLKESAL